MAKACTCKSCRAACTHLPGWYTPRDVRRLMQAYPDTWPTLVAFDRWYGEFWDINPQEDKDAPVIWVLAPPNAATRPGTIYPPETGLPLFGSSARKGQCQLFQDDRCTIHAHKPRECREYLGCDPEHSTYLKRRFIARAWARPAGQALLTEVRNALHDLTRQEALV